jgi:hypothetical protein
VRDVSKSETYVQEYPFRSTRLGGKTVVIAVCPTCRKILRPSRTRRSRAGTHGEDYYVHEHPIEALWLEQNNSGIRRIAVPPSLQPIKNQLERMWLYEGSSVGAVKNAVRAYFASK